AAAAVPTQERHLGYACQELVRSNIEDAARRVEQRALFCALVDDVVDRQFAAYLALDWQRRVEGNRLLSMENALPVDAIVRLLLPEPRMGKDNGHGRQRLQLFFIDEAQVVAAGLLPGPNAKRVKHRIATGETVMRNPRR